ncbi:MAG TPA: NBR1-Ig-like domain-containing protein [Paucimonas sp.]|nr:NBR1-Ig-like domain-containing protein [Paucimonas sp.]
MSILDLVNYVKQQARMRGISDSELARRAKISRPALLKLLSADVKCPELTTLANLAYAIDDHPYRLVSLYLAGTSPPSRGDWKTKEKRDASRFLRDVTYPDGSMVTTNQRFEKIWEIANAGERPWIGRKLVCQDQSALLYRKEGDAFVPLNYSLVPDKAELPIPDTMPGESVTLAVNFTAPNTPAWVVSYWKMKDRDGEYCFPELEGLRCCVSVIVV